MLNSLVDTLVKTNHKIFVCCFITLVKFNLVVFFNNSLLYMFHGE